MRYHETFVVLSLIHLSLGIETKRESLLDREFLKPTDTNSSISPRKAGGIRFEDAQYPDDDDLSNVSLDEPEPFRFQNNQEPGRVTFQDGNSIDESVNYALNHENKEHPTRVTFQNDNPGIKKKRRRRRRKPRYQAPGQVHPGVPALAPGQYIPGALGSISPGYNPDVPGPLPLSQYNSGGPPIPPGQYNPNPHYPGYPGLGQGGSQYYRPRRPKKQSYASEALSRVIGALTSIALYDDYQCVPRLLCEAAGGGALGTSPVLQTIAGLQPLLTLLSAYNGISSSPLFIFGRAVFLGMTAKGNTASCRYAYPQCPTDPEQLVHYLNNHNGGFFRFFNSPQPHPQNLQQFYNQLSGQYQHHNYDPTNQPLPNQNYGLYPQSGPQNPNQQFGSDQSSQNYLYGSFNQPNQHDVQQNYGLHNPQLRPNPVQHISPYQPYQQDYNNQSPHSEDPNYEFNSYPDNPQGNQYGFFNNQYPGNRNPNIYDNKFNPNAQNYGTKYSYVGKYGFQKINYKDNGKGDKIENRIQNKPTYLYVDSDVGNVDVNSKWIFPENYVNVSNNSNIRSGKLKFPEQSFINNDKEQSVMNNDKRKEKSIIFPESYKYINYYEYPSASSNENVKFSYPNYNVGSGVFDDEYNKNNYYDGNAGRDDKRRDNNDESKGYNGNKYSKYMYNNDEEEGIQTVYIVRSNGDANNPEIVKIRPGERVMI